MNLQSSNTRHLVLYFQIHQPDRLNKFNFFSIGSHPHYFNDSLNEDIINRIAKDCYLPANALLLKLIKKHPEVRVCFSISGTALDQFEKYTPEVIHSFRALADTGNVEFLAETNYHSLASLISEDEFKTQVFQHLERMYHHFGVRPSVFRNTELIYNDVIGKQVATMGFRGAITDGVERVLGRKSVYRSFSHPEENLRILLRANMLSDDIAFRYTSGTAPLNVDRYVNWLNHIPSAEQVILLGMDYETFGEHHKKSTGIFDFLQNLLTKVIRDKKIRLSTPSDVIELTVPDGKLPIPESISWADERKDLSAWLGNDMQQDAFTMIKNMEKIIKKSGDNALLETWRCLQTSDHFYYMCTKRLNDGDVHSYFSHYPSPYEAFINYMNTVNDFIIKVRKTSQAGWPEAGRLTEYERQHPQAPNWTVTEHSPYSEKIFVSQP